MTEARKSNSPLVLGFQGRSQLAKRYGLDAEAMLSQPATKIFLRTSEPDAAKWISQTLGDVETERLKQSRSSGDGWATTARHSTSYALERHVEPLVLPSQISGLANLHGYLKQGNLVTTLRVPFITLPPRHPALVPRPVSDAIGTAVFAAAGGRRPARERARAWRRRSIRGTASQVSTNEECRAMMTMFQTAQRGRPSATPRAAPRRRARTTTARRPGDSGEWHGA